MLFVIDSKDGHLVKTITGKELEQLKEEIASPVREARKIFEKLEGKPRAIILQECFKKGINSHTAATQLTKWNKERHPNKDTQ